VADLFNHASSPLPPTYIQFREHQGATLMEKTKWALTPPALCASPPSIEEEEINMDMGC